MLLGEARSKFEHLRNIPLKPEVSKELHHVALARGVHSTTAIEGNTLTEAEVRQVIDGDLELPPSQQYREQEVINIVQAFNWVKDGLGAGGSPDLTVERIKDLNKWVLDHLPLDDWVEPGEISGEVVGVARYRGAPREDCEYLLQRLCDWINGPAFRQDDPDWRMAVSIIAAITAHLYVELIHPFGDGNGRVGRMVELQVLLGAGAPTMAAHLLSNHYNATRDEYYRQLARVSAAEDPLPFIRYAIRGLVDGLSAQLGHIYQQQWADRWEQLIYERFAGRTTPADLRRRDLLIAVSKTPNQAAPVFSLTRLTPDLAAAYATKSQMALSRDINALIKMGLLERPTRGVVRARTGQLFESR